MPRPDKYYNLTRPKLRQSWHKANFYNFYKNTGKEADVTRQKTFFQQKWAAKAKTRGYHGEHIPEKKWKRMFDRRLRSAVDMHPQYLATHDGSEQSAGRGSGLSNLDKTAQDFSKVAGVDANSRFKRQFVRYPANETLAGPYKEITPYMQMTFAPLERRLDTAVFRALFASSIRQARQFVVHGGVMVNGKKMVYPAYQLNPGDMFQVDIEKVMYGTGAQNIPRSARFQEISASKREKQEKRRLESVLRSSTTKPAGDGAAKASAETEGAEGEDGSTQEEISLSPEDSWELTNRKLKSLLRDVKTLLAVNSRDLSAGDKRKLRLFRKSAARFLSKGETADEDATALMDALLTQMKSHESMRSTYEKFRIADDAAKAAEEGDGAETTKGAEAENSEDDKPKFNREKQIKKGFQELTEAQQAKAVSIMGASQLTNEEMKRLVTLLKSEEENPVDDSKPYMTPWRPRAFMSAFAFIPRYLEVNQNICAAVYLRHPVARKGLGEVPTPFAYTTSQLAHNWYLRRR